MPAIAATSIAGSGKAAVTLTTLNGTDSLTYREGNKPILVLHNPTAGAISPVIDGNGGTTVAVQGLGSVDVSGGYAVGSIAAGACVAIPLITIREYLKGTIAITGGSGLAAALLEY
jgi:hypothetical protein